MPERLLLATQKDTLLMRVIGRYFVKLDELDFVGEVEKGRAYLDIPPPLTTAA